MSRDLVVVEPVQVEGELVPDAATLDALEVMYMNFAREEMRHLEKILLTFVVPAMGGYDNELACDIARHIEQIRMFSGNFCWKHRHVGSAWGEVGTRQGIDD
ncbi:hypothetical protein [Pseudomonas alvandae]|uniref:hypothetical protein n=1 Tax=Pseudomonas canavaninivorans TaxID=2842348 RepID=UPI002B1E326A|nr:hypothetical protein [Pseudomonas canavaninivorans]